MGSKRALGVCSAMWLLAIVLAGCETLPTGRYQALCAASEGVHSNTTETFARIEKRQRDFAVLTAPDLPLLTNTFKPIVQGQSFGRLLIGDPRG